MSCPGCDGDLAVFTVSGPLESHAPEVALTVGLCTDCLRLHSAEVPPNDSASRPLASALPNGGAGVVVTLLVGMLDSLVLDRTDTVGYVEFTERPGADVHLALNRLRRMAAVPHFDVVRRQHQSGVFL